MAQSLLEQLAVNLDLCHDDVELQQWQRKKLKIGGRKSRGGEAAVKWFRDDVMR